MWRHGYVQKLIRKRNRLIQQAIEAHPGPDREHLVERLDQIEEEIKELTGHRLSHKWLFQ